MAKIVNYVCFDVCQRGSQDAIVVKLINARFDIARKRVLITASTTKDKTGKNCQTLPNS